jgi:hypothetical protein
VQALVLALCAEIARRFAHADRGGNGAIGVSKVAITASPMVFTTAPFRSL